MTNLDYYNKLIYSIHKWMDVNMCTISRESVMNIYDFLENPHNSRLGQVFDVARLRGENENNKELSQILFNLQLALSKLVEEENAHD